MNFCSEVKLNQLNPILVVVGFNFPPLNIGSSDNNFTLNHLKL
jgi:hypothetical protein